MSVTRNNFGWVSPEVWLLVEGVDSAVKMYQLCACFQGRHLPSVFSNQIGAEA